MKIGIDIDNVISNFNEELLKAYIEHDKELRNTGIINKNAPYIRNNMFDWSEQEENEFYKSNIERIAINLKPIEGASKYIKKLKKDGHIIYIISGRDNGEYPNPYKMTENWLKKYDIVYDELFLVDAYNSHSKTEICLENNVEIMIDDSKRMCKDITEHGIKAILMDTLYNRDTNEFERVHSWEEIYKDNLEYNFRQDVEAQVFKSHVKLTILPCKDVVSKLRSDINTLKENIGNKSELCDYLIERFYNDGYHGIQESSVTLRLFFVSS